MPAPQIAPIFTASRDERAPTFMVSLDNRFIYRPTLPIPAAGEGWGLQVSPYIRECVAFIGYRNAENADVALGTGFLAAVRAERVPNAWYHFLVTARHLCDKVKNFVGAYDMRVRLNVTGAGGQWFSSEAAHWQFHPSDPSVDVAVLPLPAENLPPLDTLSYPLEQRLTDEIQRTFGFEVGNDVCYPGLFGRHIGPGKNIPVLRAGTIAAFPDSRIPSAFSPRDGIDAFLVETRSIGGFSGSPVFLDLGQTRLCPDGKIRSRRSDPPLVLIGMMQGHFDEYESTGDLAGSPDVLKMNTGIAVVVPIERIMEVIDQPSNLELRRSLESAALRGIAATLDHQTDLFT